MRNYKMVLSYDGSRYKGWQRLGNGELTIQETIERAIEKVLGCKVEIQGSGRTDAGVHAKGQVANVKMPILLKEDFQKKMNDVLPEDIRLLCVEMVHTGFHSRYSAKAKSYRYYVDTKEKPDVFQRKYSCHYPEILDINAMQKAAEYLKGTHDFTSFTDDKTVGKDKQRTIYQIEIWEEKGTYCFSYYGDGFMQHMVRIITGTLLEVGKGARNPEEIAMIIEQRERAKAGFMAPAKGLFLEYVEY